MLFNDALSTVEFTYHPMTQENSPDSGGGAHYPQSRHWKEETGKQ